MSGAHLLTPRPANMALSLDKSLPPPPPDSDGSDSDTRPKLTEQLPERPLLSRAWTSAAPESGYAEVVSGNTKSFFELASPAGTNASLTPSTQPIDLQSDPGEARAYAAGNRSASVMEVGRGILQLNLGDLQLGVDGHAMSLSEESQMKQHGRVASRSPEQFFSPYLQPTASPKMDPARAGHQHTRSTSSSEGKTAGQVSPQLRKQHSFALPCSGPSMLSHDRLTAEHLADGVHTPGSSSSLSFSLGAGQSYFPGLPDPSSFPLPSTPQLGGGSGSISPAGSKLGHGSRGYAHYSSDLSYRNSTSTRGSVWTDRSQTSCGTSPGGLRSSLGAEQFPKLGDDEGEADETEEIDEESVGLGITSDQGNEAGSRRSCATPVNPSMSEGSPALSGPFSHHRVPSWTRKSDLSNLVMSFNAASVADARGRPSMARTMSEVGHPDLHHVASPSIPARRESRARCSSDSSRRGHTKDVSSTSSSMSTHSKRSGFFTPAMTYASDVNGKSGLFRTLSSSTTSSTSSHGLPYAGPVVMQSPPRTTSLKQSPSATSLRSVSRSESLSRTPSIRRKGYKLNLDKLPNAGDHIPPQMPDNIPRRGSSAADSSLSSSGLMHSAPVVNDIVSRPRRTSDASINSFLQGAEFSHILGAYAERLRWDDDGMYDLDELAETEDESQAVRTAQDGSAAIVHAKGRSCAEIEVEAGPNTTHLILRGCADPGMLDMLERVLPSTQRLLVLDLSDCNLSALPSSLGDRLTLEELDISRNPVGAIPEHISNLRALRVLSVDCIGLVSLPRSLSELQDLQYLSLRNNMLMHLPGWLHRLPRLDRLFIEGNAFKGVWGEVVHDLLPRPSLSPFALGTDRTSHSAQSAFHTMAPPKPPTRRLKSTNDLQKLTISTPTETASPTNEFGAMSGPSPLSGSTVDFDERFKQLGYNNDNPTKRPGSHMSSGDGLDETSGKWGGFLKKIGRKASSTKLGVMYNEHISPTESRASSPKTTRASLRNSGGHPRSGSVSNGSKSVRGSLSPKSKTLTILRGDQSHHAPMTPLTPSFPPVSPKSEAPPHVVADGGGLMPAPTPKQMKRRSFLPVSGYNTSASLGVDQEKDGLSQTLMDEEDMIHHRQRLRALMHYLRDLDDLTAMRNNPKLKQQPSLANIGAEVGPAAMTRESSMASAESSTPSSLCKSTESQDSSLASSSESHESGGVRTKKEAAEASQSKDDTVRRTRIIEEIIRTEETYVKGLTELVDIYVKPSQLTAEGGVGAPVVPLAEQRAVFGNVEGILRFHHDVFLPSLRSAAGPVLEHKQKQSEQALSADETAYVAEKVATVFTHHAAFFKMYMSYINNCDSAQTRINVWMASNPVINAASAFKNNSISGQSFGGMSQAHMMAGTPLIYDFGLPPAQRKKIKAFMKRCRAHPRHSQLNVESYLLLPVQRIPRYRLLLEDLVRSTDRSRLRSPESLSIALEYVARVASSVNESKRQSEQDRKLLGWQYRIRGSFESPLVQPHRRLIKDGPLRLRRIVKRVPGFIKQHADIMQIDHLEQSSENVPLTIILCNDLIVAVTDPSEGRDAILPVSLYAILRLEKPAEIIGGIHLRLVDRKAIMYFSASSPEEAGAWKTAFNLQAV